MRASRSLLFAALHGFLGTAAGAFGAHALRGRLSADRLAVFETGARYELVAALALLGLGAWLARERRPALTWAADLMALGGLLFAGSLYALALSGLRILGAVTPLGGVLMLAAWLLMARAALDRA